MHGIELSEFVLRHSVAQSGFPWKSVTVQNPIDFAMWQEDAIGLQLAQNLPMYRGLLQYEQILDKVHRCLTPVQWCCRVSG